jgi:hypothetical protein
MPHTQLHASHSGQQLRRGLLQLRLLLSLLLLHLKLQRCCLQQGRRPAGRCSSRGGRRRIAALAPPAVVQRQHAAAALLQAVVLGQRVAHAAALAEAHLRTHLEEGLG